MAPYEGSDIGEVLVATNQIQPAHFESFYNAFNNLAERTQNVSTSIDTARHPISARNAFFKASTYFRSADFFLHGNWSDPRINRLWDQQLSAFNSALEIMPIPGQRLTLNASGFQVPAVFYSSGLPGKRPTIIMCNGYDGSQEEMYHVLVKAVVERDMNAITYEGPGMPTVRRQQDLGFIPNWEAVVTPVVDWAVIQPEIDPTSIGLWGFSFGGYLAPRAAAFEHRIAAVLALDGVYDAGSAWLAIFPPELLSALHNGDAATVNEGVAQMLASPDVPTSAKWGVQQGMWSFKQSSAYDWLVAVKNYSLENVVQNIKVPVFVGEAQNDQFFAGQGKRLADHLGDLATNQFFTNAEGAGEHCSIGAQVLENQIALDWFEDIVKSSGCKEVMKTN